MGSRVNIESSETPPIGGFNISYDWENRIEIQLLLLLCFVVDIYIPTGSKLYVSCSFFKTEIAVCYIGYSIFPKLLMFELLSFSPCNYCNMVLALSVLKLQYIHILPSPAYCGFHILWNPFIFGFFFLAVIIGYCFRLNDPWVDFFWFIYPGRCLPIAHLCHCLTRRSRYRETPPKKQDAPSSKREEDEDNWDLPEGDIPYWPCLPVFNF